MNRSQNTLAKVAPLWAAPPQVTLTQWAEANFHLSAEASADTGLFRAKPFQVEVLDAFTDPRVETVVVMSATQMLKTTSILVALGYIIDRDPGPTMLVAPRDTDVQKFSKIRLAPMLRDTPCLRSKVSEGKGGGNSNTLDYKKFDGGLLAMTAAGSPGNLAALPIRYLLCDEVDKYPASAGAEGDPISLARKRTITYRRRRKVVLTCSPTVAGRSRIGKAYDGSDRREYYVPCHKCESFQTLKWGQVRWDTELPEEQRPATAHYVCEHCGAKWNELQRNRAVDKGHWRSHGVFTGTAGFRISELYSPWRSLPEIVADFFRVKDDREQFKTFVNTTLCELWAEEGETPEWEIIYGRREDYPHSQEAVVPRRGLFLTCAVDVQDDRLEYEVMAWGRGKETWSIEYGVIRVTDGSGGYLKTSDPRVWAELDPVLYRDYQHENGKTMPIMVMTIDTGSRSRPVFDFALRHARPAYGPAGARIAAPRTVVPIKGSSKLENYRVIAGISGEDASKKRNGIRIVSLGTGVAKQEIYDNLRLPRPASPDHYSPGYCHFPDYDEAYFQGLCSEKRIVRDDGQVEWEKLGRNEPLDCRVYNLAAAVLFGIDRFNASHWRQLEDALGVAAPLEVLPAYTPLPTPPTDGSPAPPRPMNQPRTYPPRRVVRSSWMGR